MLVSVEDAQAAVPALSGKSQGVVEAEIALAVSAIQDYLHRPLEEALVSDEYVSGTIGCNLCLKRYPIIEVVSVSVHGEVQAVESVTPSTTMPLDASKVWRLPGDDKAGILYRPQGWPCEGVWVTYTGGWTSETLPQPLREAIFAVIRCKLNSVGRENSWLDGGPTGPLVRHRTVGGQEREWAKPTSDGSKRRVRGYITKEVAQMIRRYSWKGLLK